MSKRWIVFWALAVAAGCERHPATGDTHVREAAATSVSTVAEPPPKPAASATPPAPSAATPKKAPHEGVTAKLREGEARISAIKAGHFRVWLVDDHEDIAPIDGVTAHISANLPGYPEVTLKPTGDHFEGEGPQITVDHPIFTIRIERNGKTETGKVKAHLESGPVGHHHHDEDHHD